MRSAPSDPIEPAVLRVEHLTTIGRAEEAVRLLTTTSDTPTSFRAMFQLSRAYDKLERYDMALDAAQAAIALNPEDQSGWILSALALGTLDRPVEALPAARTAVHLAPEFHGAHGVLAGILADLGRFDEAYRHASLSTSLDPGQASGWMTLAGVQLAHHRWADAEKSARVALSINPESDQAKLLLSVAQANQGGIAGEVEAMDTLVASLRSNPDQETVRKLLVALVKPRRLPFPLWLAAPITLAGGAGFLLLAWAGWVAMRWHRTPADVRKLVLAQRSARWQIAFGLLGATVMIVGFLAVFVVAAIEVRSQGCLFGCPPPSAVDP